MIYDERRIEEYIKAWSQQNKIALYHCIIMKICESTDTATNTHSNTYSALIAMSKEGTSTFKKWKITLSVKNSFPRTI